MKMVAGSIVVLAAAIVCAACVQRQYLGGEVVYLLVALIVAVFGFFMIIRGRLDQANRPLLPSIIYCSLDFAFLANLV